MELFLLRNQIVEDVEEYFVKVVVIIKLNWMKMQILIQKQVYGVKFVNNVLQQEKDLHKLLVIIITIINFDLSRFSQLFINVGAFRDYTKDFKKFRKNTSEKFELVGNRLQMRYDKVWIFI